MTRDEAVQRIQRTLGFRTDKVTEIQDALKDAQDRFEQSGFLPWFLLTEVSSASTVSGEERVAVPTDFLREYEDDALFYFNGSATAAADKWKPLVKDELQTLRNDLPGSGTPVAYALDRKYFRIFPTPDAAYALKLLYYKTDVKLDTNIENDWLKHAANLLVGEAGVRMAGALRDRGAIAEFARMAADGGRDLLSNAVGRETAGRRYVMGGPD